MTLERALPTVCGLCDGLRTGGLTLAACALCVRRIPRLPDAATTTAGGLPPVRQPDTTWVLARFTATCCRSTLLAIVLRAARINTLQPPPDASYSRRPRTPLLLHYLRRYRRRALRVP